MFLLPARAAWLVRYSVLFEEWSRTGHDNNRKYLLNGLRTGRWNSWTTPLQCPRAFCMSAGTGRSGGASTRGYLCTMWCPVRGRVPVGSSRHEIRGVAASSVRGRRLCGPGAAWLATAAPAASPPSTARRAFSRLTEKGDIAALPPYTKLKGSRPLKIGGYCASFYLFSGNAHRAHRHNGPECHMRIRYGMKR